MVPPLGGEPRETQRAESPKLRLPSRCPLRHEAMAYEMHCVRVLLCIFVWVSLVTRNGVKRLPTTGCNPRNLKGKAPARMREIHSILEDAACYVCITPEYNHSPSPALLNILNYFGSSTFSFKPSAIGMSAHSYHERRMVYIHQTIPH